MSSCPRIWALIVSIWTPYLDCEIVTQPIDACSSGSAIDARGESTQRLFVVAGVRLDNLLASCLHANASSARGRTVECNPFCMVRLRRVRFPCRSSVCTCKLRYFLGLLTQTQLRAAILSPLLQTREFLLGCMYKTDITRRL